MSDPGALAKNLLQQNFSKLGTIRRPVTYKEMGSAAYTVATGVVEEVVQSSNFLEVVWLTSPFAKLETESFKPDDINLLSIDQIALFPALDLPVKPKIGDQIVDEFNVTWIVMAVSTDPAGAHYQLHSRPKDVT